MEGEVAVEVSSWVEMFVALVRFEGLQPGLFVLGFRHNFSTLPSDLVVKISQRVLKSGTLSIFTKLSQQRMLHPRREACRARMPYEIR